MTMDDDEELTYLTGYKPDHLYVHPAPGVGAYAKLIAEEEEVILDTDVSDRARLVVTLFHHDGQRDYTNMKIQVIRRHGTHWRRDGSLSITRTQRAKLQEFLRLMLALDLQGATKHRVAVDQLDLNTLSAILRTDRGGALLKDLANSPELSADIFALAHKKRALGTFEGMLRDADARAAYVAKHGIRKSGEEAVWQHFFEANPWIFGHGLNYVFLDKVGKKLEAITTGTSHYDDGNRVDALMRTRAAISQYVLIEIKTPSAGLVKTASYRTGCWAVTSELTEAVSQIQKTAYDFTSNQFDRVALEDSTGRRTGEEVFRIQPKTYLVTGNLADLHGYDDKFTCFQLFRNSLTSPEIITFDELFERAKCIFETISAGGRKVATRYGFPRLGAGADAAFDAGAGAGAGTGS